MATRLATSRDWSYVLNLSKKHAEELGFIPAAAMQNYLHRGRVSMATENGDPAGYFLAGGLSVRQLRIFQACVQTDARGLRHGLFLVSDLITRAASSGTQFITLHCRDGLESNGFWSACGFRLASTHLGGAARKKIVHTWQLDLRDALRDPALPYASHLLASLRAGTPASTLTSACKTLTTAAAAEQMLDPQETNVTHATRTREDSRSFAGEALRTLHLAHALPR